MESLDAAGHDETLREQRVDGAAVLTLHRPHRRNALDARLLRDLRARIDAGVADDSVRVLVVTGAPPAFCAGLDLDEVRTGREEPGKLAAMVSDLAAIYAAIESADKPVVAAVNGAAVAGGAGLAAVCDLVIAAESAQIGFPGIRRGLVAPVLHGPLLRSVGTSWARYLLLTGELLDARRARDIGLVHEVTADGSCLERALGVARRLAQMPAGALAATKRTLRQCAGYSQAGHPAKSEGLLLFDADGDVATQRDDDSAD